MFRHNLLFLNMFLLLAATAAGCASINRPPAGGDFWVTGKVGVRDGSESYSARFTWQQDGPRYEIGLWGPLGQGRTHLQGDAEHLEIVGGDGELVRSGHPETVMYEHLNWSLPLDVLPFWMQGQPSPTARVEDPTSDTGGRLTSFRQLGWEITYERYKAYGEASLPSRITAQKADYRLRLVVSDRQI